MSLSPDIHLTPNVLSPRLISVPLSLAPGARAPYTSPPLPMAAALVATSKSERPHKYNPLGGNWRSATNGNTESRKLAVVPPGGPGGTNSGPSLHTIHWIAFNNLLRLVSSDLNVLRSAHLKVQSNLGVFEIARLVGFPRIFCDW